jgi:hypothetical protein
MKAIVFAGTDGHGATMGVISARNLRAQGFEVVLDCRWPQTGKPSQFWGETFLSANYDGVALAVVVDTPLPEPDGTFPNAVNDAIAKIAELTASGTRVVIIDHHKVAETHYHRARSAGAEVVITSSAPTCFWGEPSPFAEKWGRLGGICDLDDAVLPVTAEEETVALGLDAAVRKNLQAAMAAIEADDMAYFAGQANLPPIPGEVSVQGNTALATETTPTWGFKQLSALAGQTGADYALGVDCFNGFWRVIAITSWKSNALPVALKLGMTRFIGHGKAILVPVCPAQDVNGRGKAMAKAMEFQQMLAGTADSGGNTNVGSGLSLFGYVSAFMRRVHVPFFLTLHGWGHVEHVVGHARTLGSLFDLTEREQRLLDWAALFHDVGNGAGTVYGVGEKEARERHHEFSAQMINEWRARGLFSGIIPDQDVFLVADLCLRHRKKMPLPEDSRQRLLCVLLRVADGMDIDSRRAQKNDEGRFFEELDLPEESLPHWEGHRAITALRVVANGGLVFEIIVTDRAQAAFQVAEISKELKCLDGLCAWKVRVIGPDA